MDEGNIEMTGGRIKTSFVVSLAAGFAMMLPAPLPRIAVQSPSMMYAMAWYDVAVGHTEEAAKLVSEAGKKAHSTRQSMVACSLPSKS
jgi:hypothetical protein